MLIDTHCHLDAAAFDADRDEVIARARDAGVRRIVIPAVHAGNFHAVRQLAHAFPEGAYALGLHPLSIPHAQAEDLQALARALDVAMQDGRLVAVGEIGLDFYLPHLCTPAMRERQEHFFVAQLGLARERGLPVILHVRRAQDRILKYLRAQAGLGGIAHAFNGSLQQAQQFTNLGFALGAGGAMTFQRARRIRRLVQEIGLCHWVLETDAPDIAPAWLDRNDGGARNEPGEIARIAEVFAQVRGEDTQTVISATGHNARRVLPRLQGLSPA